MTTRTAALSVAAVGLYIWLIPASSMAQTSFAALWEMFNVFNTDNFQAYQGSLESSTFGQPARALAKRRQQFGFRIDF